MALLTVAVLVGVLFMIAARVDQDALLHEQALVQRGVEAKIADVERAISPQVVWDDAVTHLANDFDPTWARENVGAYLLGQAGFDLIFIVDHTGRPVFSAEVGQVISSARYDRHAPIFAPMVARLRAEERLRPRPTGPRPDGGLVSRPLQFSVVEPIDGEPYLVTVSLVQPDFGKSLVRHRQAPVVITALKLDAVFLEGFSDRFLLAGVHLHKGDATAQPGEAHVALRDLDGKVVATLDWQPPHPGQRLLRKAVLSELGYSLTSIVKQTRASPAELQKLGYGAI